MNERGLHKQIEHLRSEMVLKAREKGSFVDETVVLLSQQLDLFLLQVQLLHMNDHDTN